MMEKYGCPRDGKGNIRDIVCFVPSCCNKMWRDGKKNRLLHFFKVPDDIEGLFWTKAVRKTGVKNTKRLTKLGRPTKYSTKNGRYCCEAHFDVSRIVVLDDSYNLCIPLQITQDIDRIVNDNGTVEFRVKRKVYPTVERRQRERLFKIHATDNLLESDCDTVITFCS